MRPRPLVSFVATAALVVAFGAGLGAQDRTETVDRTVPLPANGTVELKNFSGPVRITGATGNDVVIHAVRRAPQERLERIQLTIETTGSRVIINANQRDEARRNRDDRNNVVETEFEIRMPADGRLNVDAFSSDVTIAGVNGSQTLETFSGDIVVRDSRGAITAETFSGAIDIDASASGTAPEIGAETFSGNITVRLAENATGSVRFDTFSGGFESALPLNVRSVRRSRTEGDLPGGAGRTLRFHTFSGNVRIVR